MQMRARYIGDPSRNGEGPANLKLFGRTWPKGSWVELDTVEPAFRGVAAAKLPNNSHFETDASEVTAAGARAAQNPSSGAAAFDHDGDGNPGGSLPESADPDAAEKAEIREELKLLNEQDPHPRTGIAKLRQIRDSAREKAAFLRGDED